MEPNPKQIVFGLNSFCSKRRHHIVVSATLDVSLSSAQFFIYQCLLFRFAKIVQHVNFLTKAS